MSFISKITRRLRSDRAIGHKSKADQLLAIVTLRRVRQNAGRWLSSFFAVSQPSWLNALERVRYSPTKKLTWWDYANPIYWMVWVVGFSYRWLISRPYLSLGPALLAVLAIVGLGGLMVRQSLESRDWRGQFYQRALVDAVRNNQDSKAEVCLTNLISRYPEKADWRFQQALLFEKKGDHLAAYREMMALADRREFGAAALWLIATQFDMQKVSTWTPEMHARYRKLAEIALKDRRGSFELDTRRKLAEYFMRIGATQDALIHLTALAESSPAAILNAAKLYAQIGDEQNTVRYAQMAKKHYEKQLLLSSDNKVARLSLAQAELLLHQEEKAAMLLSDGYKITRDEDLAVAGAETLVAWSMRLKQSDAKGTSSLIKQMDLLNKASQLAPTSEMVLNAIVEVAIDCAENDTNEVGILRRGLLNGMSPNSLHFIEGTVALYKGDLKQADFHLGLAAKGDLKLPGVLNNLAVVLYQKDPPELDRALVFANAALERVDHPYLRETRGQILVKLGKHEDAIVDLELALQAQALALGVHKSLATAYKALGDTALADQHSAMAASLSNKQERELLDKQKSTK